ncbi:MULTISPECIES: DNA-binding protein [unclassified Mesorhizobium]|uniref:DNA-binding protein n=1 Tax=unclassified Mesorhizobium TaxID=325217 RepID=UPI001FEF3D69|nr:MULTISPECIES: DNA-binding protein [unclassified Mesorhizobium]
MADFDFEISIRWARFAFQKGLSRRNDDELPFLVDTAEAGQELMLNTCVYIDGLQGRAPDVVADLLDLRLGNHSTVAVQELMHTVDVLDPKHPGTKGGDQANRQHHQAHACTSYLCTRSRCAPRAALLSGILCRLQAYQKDACPRALHDRVKFLQAQKTRLQLIPTGRVLFYRPK